MMRPKEEKIQSQNLDPVYEEEVPRVEMPVAPPNYRGMIYDMEPIGQIDQNDQNAEGIDRLVRNDSEYSDYGKRLRHRDYMLKRNNSEAFSHMRPQIQHETEKVDKAGGSGLQRLIEGLQNKSYVSEDVLICAMILLMLNSSSEDDVLTILVLMMLL